jgi:hypothetical protein
MSDLDSRTVLMIHLLSAKAILHFALITHSHSALPTEDMFHTLPS